MDTIKINWLPVPFNYLKKASNINFYAFTKRDTLLFIGSLYQQDIELEIRTRLNGMDENLYGLSIWLGSAYPSESSFSRISEKMVLNTVCLLAKVNEPKHASSNCDDIEQLLNDLRIVNTGCSLIQKCSRLENGLIHHTF